MIDKLQDLKDIYQAAKTQLERNKQPLEDLLKLNASIAAVVQEPSLVLDHPDKEYKKFFLEELAFNALKKLTLEKSQDEKYQDVIASIFENFLRLFLAMLKLGQYHAIFFDSIRNVFNYDTIMHLYSYQISEEELKRLRSANQEWRKELKEGDMVDAIIDEASSRCSGWSQARIDQVNGDTLHLEFINDTKSADRYIDRWSVEIAQFETKTKDLFAWKHTLAAGQMIDAHDKTVWNKSTILEIVDQAVGPGRTAKMAHVGFRIYQENGSKSDEKGAYEGWSNRFDEWISIFSPRIQLYLTKTLRGTSDDQDLEDNFDNLVKPEPGHTRVYGVPRLRKCTSSLFIHLLNVFGNEGGFDLVLERLSKDETSPEGGAPMLDLNLLGIIVGHLSQPYQIYHREFIQEYAPKFVEVCLRRLREASDKSLRDVRRERIEGIIKSIDNFQRRLVSKDERERTTETLKLEVALMCLKSSFLERRIQGIRDLNQVIKNNRMFAYKSFTGVQLIDWMDSNGVFALLFDSKRTHLQIVQRCNDVIRLLLQEDRLSQEIIEAFWSLARADYKFEVYKIINEVSLWLGQAHIDFFFDQIKLIPAEKMALEEFQCLSELGKNSKEPRFKSAVTDFFWDIVCNSEAYKEELVNNCITKFCEMVKYWDMRAKHDFFLGLTKNLAANKSSIPSLRLFKGLLKDQKDRFTYAYASSPAKTAEPDDLTLASSLQTLVLEAGLVTTLLANLTQYIEEAAAKGVQPESDLSNRKKLHIVTSKYSHHEEVDERLQFLKYIATISADYQVSKSELDTLYRLLAERSPVPSDQEEFLVWCKSSCEQSTATSQILDLNEVGEFFSEKMNSGSLDLKNLLLVGFDFLQQYFLSVNESSQKLIKALPKKPAVKVTSYTGGYSVMYGPNAYGGYGPTLPKSTFGKGDKAHNEDIKPSFKVLKHPHELDKLEIVWNIALQCQNPEVVPKAIDFLIKVYYSLDADLDSERIRVQDDLIERCMSICHGPQAPRVLEILKHVIIEAEKKGTGEVKPHSALLKGELLDRIQVKNRASPNVQLLLISIYSNTTFWDFKRQVAEKLGLAPKYLKLQRFSGKAIKDTENGRTLAELGFSSTEQLTAFKVNIEEEVPAAPLINIATGKLTEKAEKIFNEWFDLYSNEDGRMTKETCALFIKGCTGEQPLVTDDRIVNLFKAYDTNNDGFIERSEFITFYESAARSKPDTVRENLRHHNIRPDLKKLSELTEQESFLTQDMPRLKISKRRDYFDTLMGLLDQGGQTSEAAWNLIQMLATSPEIYTHVLQLKSALDAQTGEINWAKFFDSSNSVYKLLYTLQIVEAVMEEGEGEGLEHFDVIDETEAKKKNPPPQAPPLPGAGVLPPGFIPSVPKIKIEEVGPYSESPQPLEEETSQSYVKKQLTIVDRTEDDKLKAEWTAMFLQGRGFQYILQVFMSHKGTGHSQFELKHVAFLLKLLRIFIMAAFSTSSLDSYAAVTLVRRSSALPEAAQGAQEEGEGSRFQQLQKLLTGPLGEELLTGIDYRALVQKILLVMAETLGKPALGSEDKLIVDNALSLLVGCLLHKPELIDALYSFTSPSISSCDELLLLGLLYCPQDKTREEFKQSLSCLARKLRDGATTPLDYLLRLLSANFARISDYPCKQFFELFCELIDQYFLAKTVGNVSQEQVFNPENLLSVIIDKIQAFNQAALQKSASDEGLYIGLVQLTGKIIDNFDLSMCERLVQQKHLVEELFVRFLFASVFQQSAVVPVASGGKVRPKRLLGETESAATTQVLGRRAKEAAYLLLNQLIKKSPLLLNGFLDSCMLPLLSLVKRQDTWNYQPPGAAAEGKQKFCGLKNLGCICYMNAMMQQFFMIPAFRYNLLSVDDSVPEDLREYKGHQIDDNVLHQLQKLMAHLELSDRPFYDPYEFCFAFKDFEGNPTNTGEQKDAQEFLNMSFDRIETMLKGTSRKYLMQSVFGGQTCSQVVCLECGTCKNRIEDFYNLSLTVKDIKSMGESLQKQVEGEVINEYECENCKKRVDISKRVLLSSSPNVLIVHLQRIIFNFDTFRNDKINSFFEFPHHLDLKPYSFYEVMRKEGRLDKKPAAEDAPEEEAVPAIDETWPAEEDCWEYKLVGVTVHSGTAHAGHYWSYINTKRGHSEPEASDPAWAKTESDPWMEFNDSTVKHFNFEKLKEECYGNDGASGSDNWGFGGSYGKSAYMLIYERKEKKPIKILLTEEAAREMPEAKYDAKKEEYYHLLDYRRGVEEIEPSKIYRQVSEDNQQFEFDNDIYSQEFFDFVRSVLLSVQAAAKLEAAPGLLSEVKSKALIVGKKVIMDLLARCYHNACIKQMVEALIDVMKQDEELPAVFLAQCYKEDGCDYLLEILLECTDASTRLYVSGLIKFVVLRLKKQERDRLHEVEELTTTSESGSVTTVSQPASLCARFILKCLSLLNTKVAKNWSRFENFLELLFAFGCSEELSAEVEGATEESNVGLYFLQSVRFVERACDFMLGKKSPLCLPGEKRFEMGGSYNQPNFSPIIKLLTKILTNPALLEAHPLTEVEKKMFLHADLLKVMLSAQSGGKQFGQCIANMCYENAKMSQKVSKVFIKAINSASYDNVKNFLSALKPFVRLQDSLKAQRLEWVFGFSQVIAKKQYREERFKYGLEFVERSADDAHTYICPLACTLAEESLLAQLLKCKGKLDTFAINCLKEMLSLMAKDEDVARYVYSASPPTYQVARYSDWIRPYLEYQKAEVERTNSYAYFKSKHDAIVKSLDYCTRFEKAYQEPFFEAERARYLQASQDPAFKEEVLRDWMGYTHEDVHEQFPPQLIIGKQTQDDVDFLVYDEDPLVKVTISEVICEYNYSNPTGLFNLSIPHIVMKTNNYNTMSYYQQKQMQFEASKRIREEEAKEAASSTASDPQEDGKKDPQEEEVTEESVPQLEEMPALVVRNWFDNKREGAVLLKVQVTNRLKKKVKVSLLLEPAEGQDPVTLNMRLPVSELKDKFYDADTKVFIHLVKIDPRLPWGRLKVRVIAKEEAAIPRPPAMLSINGVPMQSTYAESVKLPTLVNFVSAGTASDVPIPCSSCKHINYQGMTFCAGCGESVDGGDMENVQVIDNYYGSGNGYGNPMY